MQKEPPTCPTGVSPWQYLQTAYLLLVEERRDWRAAGRRGIGGRGLVAAGKDGDDWDAARPRPVDRRQRGRCARR
jgi:hypothetical protein